MLRWLPRRDAMLRLLPSVHRPGGGHDLPGCEWRSQAGVLRELIGKEHRLSLVWQRRLPWRLRSDSLRPWLLCYLAVEER